MKNLTQTEIDTPDGVALLEQIYITELGHVMVRIYYKNKGIWINKKVSSLESLLSGTGFSKKGECKLLKRK